MDMSPITKKILDHYKYFNNDPAEINKGECTLWAFMAQKVYGGVLCFANDQNSEWDLGGHCFLAKNGKYYDSETPQGTPNWRDLNYFSFHPKIWKKEKIISCTKKTIITEHGWSVRHHVDHILMQDLERSEAQPAS